MFMTLDEAIDQAQAAHREYVETLKQVADCLGWVKIGILLWRDSDGREYSIADLEEVVFG